MTRRFGFTLAEVLITLGIIGVVAAMTIPTLMNQTGQAEFKTGFKKMMSTLNQAVTMNVALEDTDFSMLSSTGTATTETSMYNLFNNRMNVIRTATNTADIGVSANNYTLFFNDGMAISFENGAMGCTEGAPCKGLVDVNGTKKPNILSNCTGGRTATTDNEQAGAVSRCTEANAIIGDQFSIKMFDQQVLPNGAGARYVMFK